MDTCRSRKLKLYFLYRGTEVIYSMERETGIEPATFSLGNWLSIENNEHSVSGI
jgi:hypothetical protein